MHSSKAQKIMYQKMKEAIIQSSYVQQEKIQSTGYSKHALYRFRKQCQR